MDKVVRSQRIVACWGWLAALGSGALLRIAYAPFNESEAAWFALVPLIVAARASSPRRAFRLGLASGLVFWCTALAWLWRLTDNGGPWPLVVLGHLGLSLYCALSTGLFAAVVAKLWERVPEPDDEDEGRAPAEGRPDASRPVTPWGDLRRSLLAVAAWVALEVVRSTFLTGFAWNHLGVSQSTNRAILQLARIGGVYLVSACVLLLNAVLAGVVLRIWRGARGRERPQRHWDLMVTLTAVVVVFLWGTREVRHLEQRQELGETVMVAAVQPDAPSIFERDEASAVQFLERLRDRTDRVAAFRPDVIVWPETVLLGAVPRDAETMEYAFETARRADAPLLAGAVEVQEAPGRRRVVANVSWLFQPEGRVSDRYRKQHLVPFGEFIPLDRWFPILERLSPIGYSCTAGTNSVTMRIPLRGGLGGGQGAVAPEGKFVALSPLICFEDTVAPLARRAVLAGAALLVNQSNDAWFSGSSEGEQHHAQAVFRAVENAVPLVRCSNAGVTAVIDPTGRSSEPSDYFAMAVAPRGPDWPVTPYTRWGNALFAWPCLAWTLLLVARWVRNDRAAKRRHGGS